MITPVDLETMVFRRGFRGYNVHEVQEFMVKMTHDYEHLYRENMELKEKLDDITVKLGQYQAMEETLRNAMVLAQETAEEVKNSSRQQADLIIRDAEQKGELVKSKIKEEIQGEIQKLAALKNQVEFFKSQFKSFLKGLLDIAENQLELKIETGGILSNAYGKEASSNSSGSSDKPSNETDDIHSSSVSHAG